MEGMTLMNMHYGFVRSFILYFRECVATDEENNAKKKKRYMRMAETKNDTCGKGMFAEHQNMTFALIDRYCAHFRAFKTFRHRLE